jgi:cytoskeletal protein RodZ
MDVDPKPQDESLTPPMGSAAPSNESFNNPQPVVAAPSPVIAAALEEYEAQDKEPQMQSPIGSSVVAPVIKKSHTKLLVIVVIIVLLIIAGLVWYMFFKPAPATKVADHTATTQSSITPATPATNAATIDNAVSSLSTRAGNEATAASTDDSGNATDAGTTAGNVGGSINENNF